MREKSPIEKMFWEKAKPIIPELEDEVWIDKYRVDFLIPSKKIIIELYGYEYHKSKEKITKDAKRERHLQKLGYQIIRFTGSEIYKDVGKCVQDVLLVGRIENKKEVKTKRKKNDKGVKIVILIILGMIACCLVLLTVIQIIRIS